jgi:hydrogenase 3 maturation protease
MLSPVATNLAYRVAIVGIGSELRGDDRIGTLIVKKLIAYRHQKSNLLIAEGGTLPESFTGPLRKFSPNYVLLIDAADMNAQPGEIRLIEPEELGGYNASTHSFPLSTIIEYLKQEFSCEVDLLGIQPKSIDFGSSLSDEGRKAANQVVREINAILSRLIED